MLPLKVLLFQLVKFQEDNVSKLGTGQREVKQAIEKGENNLAWMEANYGTIFEFLQSSNSAN